MENITLKFYEEAPDLAVKGRLEILPLAPLSMVSAHPGSYFCSELLPTDMMLYGMCENALGWHFSGALRKELHKKLTKRVKKLHKKNETFQEHPWLLGQIAESGSKYFSLLQHHLAFTVVAVPNEILTYDDLWSMSNRANSINFVGGSRNYDSRLEGVINLSKIDKVLFGDRKEFATYSLEELRNLSEGKVKVTALSPYFPMYYSSPRKRGYVEADEPYLVDVNCSVTLASLLKNVFESPEAPLYLGHSEGWVDVKWIDHE